MDAAEGTPFQQKLSGLSSQAATVAPCKDPSRMDPSAADAHCSNPHTKGLIDTFERAKKKFVSDGLGQAKPVVALVLCNYHCRWHSLL